MKPVMPSQVVSQLACSPGFAIPRDRTFFNNNSYYQSASITEKVTDNNNASLQGVTVTTRLQKKRPDE